MTYFKIACFAMIFTCVFHMAGQLQGPMAENPTEQQLIDMMTAYKMDVGFGSTITMMGIQEGFGMWFSMSLLWAGITGLFLTRILKGNTHALRKISIINTVALTLGIIISIVYFFYIPTTCIGISLIFFAIASIRLK